MSYKKYNFTQNNGYSKSILCAIKKKSTIDDEYKSEKDCNTVQDNCSVKSEISNPVALNNIEINLNSTEVLSKNATHKRKSISCEFIGLFKSLSNDFKTKENFLQKSQSFNQVDKILKSKINEISEKNYNKSQQLKIKIFNSSLNQSENKIRTVSTDSNSSDKKLYVEPLSFSICSKALYACSTGNITKAKKLFMENPLLINYAYPHCYRLTCLHVAAKNGNLMLVQFLLNNGANPNSKDDTWSTPLHLAAQANHSDIVYFLHSFGGDLQALDAYGNTCLSYMSKNYKNFDNKNCFEKDVFLTPSTNYFKSPTLSTANFFGSQTFYRVGSLKPLRKKYKKVKDLFYNV